MARNRVVRAELSEVRAFREKEGCGVWLDFTPIRSRLGVDTLSDRADLGPEHCVPSVRGLGRVMRILRAARIAVPDDPLYLLGRETLASELLERAIGTPLVLEVKPRSRIRFSAWTEAGVETIDHVSEVVETEDEVLIFLHGGRYPLRISRSDIVRQQTETERWFEVASIDRAE